MTGSALTFPTPSSLGSLDNYIQAVNRFPLLTAEQEAEFGRRWKATQDVEAARAMGAGPWRIMIIDILPNVIAPIIVYTTLLIPVSIVGEATLSYLSVGVQPPTADWGQMISDAQGNYHAWWFLVFPSLALLVTTLAFNIFGDGVRDAFDPRSDRMFK
jgi:ABC-type dipeptide/oligopeptide/nickel transport system permease subunit